MFAEKTLNQLERHVVPFEKRDFFLKQLFFSKSDPLIHERGCMSVLGFTKKYANGYEGGEWEFVECQNGAIYMYPKEYDALDLKMPNYFKSTFSGEDVGIVMTSYALSTLMFDEYHKGRDSSSLNEMYRLLRDYSLCHPRASDIISAID